MENTFQNDEKGVVRLSNADTFICWVSTADKNIHSI